ncbi:MAG: hypothetical protein J7J68_00425 [Thermotogaceae bacterium]|nr:hypothetical protein [Thermotogaceae bacterium]
MALNRKEPGTFKERAFPRPIIAVKNVRKRMILSTLMMTLRLPLLKI